MNNQPSPQPQPQTQVASVHLTIPIVKPFLTYGLLACITLLYIYLANLTVPEQNTFLLDWAKINDAIFNGEYHRLLTSTFIHLDLTHFLFNAYALYLFGREVEAVYGHGRFVIIYFLGGLGASVASLIYTEAPSIGASGAIFAVFSAEAVFYYHHRHIFGKWGQSRITQMGILAVVNIIFGLLPEARIDNAAHIGGMLGGFLLAWFICPQIVVRDLNTDRPYVMDDNPMRKWLLVPIVFAIGLVITVIAFSTV